MAFYNNLPTTQAQVSGTLGGIICEPLLLSIPASFWEHIGMTALTTTVSFALPFLYKWLIKKYTGK
jgi:hypothetical protein